MKSWEFKWEASKDGLFADTGPKQKKLGWAPLRLLPIILVWAAEGTHTVLNILWNYFNLRRKQRFGQTSRKRSHPLVHSLNRGQAGIRSQGSKPCFPCGWQGAKCFWGCTLAGRGGKCNPGLLILDMSIRTNVLIN